MVFCTVIMMFKCALRIKNGENKNTNYVAKTAKGNSFKKKARRPKKTMQFFVNLRPPQI